MSTLKQLRLRISGVKSTQKITKTMKMVAASKLLKAQDQKEQAKPYADKMYNVISQLSASSDDNSSTLLTGNGKNNIHLLVAVNSDRGLCGGFNSSIARNIKKHIKILEANDKKYKILCLGKKVFDQIKLPYQDSVIEIMPGFSNQKLSYIDAHNLAAKIISMFDKGEFDVCTFIYNEFKNALKQNISARKLIPLDKELSSQVKDKQHHLYEYEPSEETLLQQILPLNLAVQIYYILLESTASEHGARMTAMDAATNNANDMIARLTLLYNRSRQAAITRELIEIISSAEVI